MDVVELANLPLMGTRHLQIGVPGALPVEGDTVQKLQEGLGSGDGLQEGFHLLRGLVLQPHGHVGLEGDALSMKGVGIGQGKDL